MQHPLYFVDGTDYPLDDFKGIAADFSKNPDICVIRGDSFQFKVVGVLCHCNKPIIIYPKNFKQQAKEHDKLSDARLLIRVILRYRNESKVNTEETPFLYGNDGLSSGRIAAAFFLLDDYCRNGFLQRKYEYTNRKLGGRVDWNSTVNKELPFLSQKNPIYLTPITRRKKLDETNLVVLTHKYIIHKCFCEWGCLFGYDGNINGLATIPASIEEMLYHLKKELRHTYIKRESLVIKHLIQYLEEEQGTNSKKKIEIMATPCFYYVWEFICGYLMENQYASLKHLLPQPVWESNSVEGRLSQRPDIFSVIDESLYILDAKYYDYNQTIPGWKDVVKQLFYRHSLRQVQTTERFTSHLPHTNYIFNGFLFPGNDEDISYLGRFHVPEASDLGEIKAFAINQKKAMIAYAYRNTQEFCNKLRLWISESFSKKS